VPSSCRWRAGRLRRSRAAQVAVPLVALAAALVAVPLSGAVHGSGGLALPAPTYLSHNIDDYVALAGDQVVVVPDGTYTAGSVQAPHAATSGPYRGWLVLVAQDRGQVVVDPGFGNRLWLQGGAAGAATSRVLFVGFSFRSEVVDDGTNIAFWYCDHQDADDGYLQRAGNHVPNMFTVGSGVGSVGPLGVYGDDFHNAVATPVMFGTSVTGATLQGLRVFGIDGRFDGYSGAAGTDPRNHVETVGAYPGPVADVKVLDTYLEGAFSLWGTDAGSDHDLLFQDIWSGFGYQSPFQLSAGNGNSVTGARRIDWQVFGPGAGPAVDPLVYVDSVQHSGADALAQQSRVQLSDTGVSYGYPVGVSSPADAEDSASNPAAVWRTAHPYDTWPAFFGWPPPTSSPPSTVPPAYPSGANVAAFAMVTASSEDFATTQVAAKVVDGSPLGWPVDYTHEWATAGGGVGSWLKLAWSSPVALDHVVLYDRPNSDDQVTASTLTFDDGTTVQVPPLPNDGAPQTVAFPAPHTTTSILFTVTGVSATTQDVGLAEIEAWSAAAPPPPTTLPPATTAPPTTAPPTTAPPSTSTTAPSPPASSSLNSVARIVYSMSGPHEGPMHGVPPSWSWGSTPQVDDAADGMGYAAIAAWGQVYADANAAEPAQGSVRVELRDMEAYVWSISQARWVRAQAAAQVQGAHYAEDFANNASTAADWQAEPDGGASSSMVSGFNLHFWPGARGTVSPGDVGGVYVTFQARLIGPAAGSAKYLANAGADWWQTTTAPYPDNAGVGEGRFMYLSANWAAIDFYTGGAYGPSAYPPAWSAAQLAASGPPLDAMGVPAA